MQQIEEQTLNTYEYSQVDKLNKLELWAIKQKVNHLRGEVLTIIDAVLGGNDSLKPTKDLVHRAFTGHETVLHNMAYDGSKLSEEDNDPNSDNEVRWGNGVK
jgi:hypothetical protein